MRSDLTAFNPKRDQFAQAAFGGPIFTERSSRQHLDLTKFFSGAFGAGDTYTLLSIPLGGRSSGIVHTLIGPWCVPPLTLVRVRRFGINQSLKSSLYSIQLSISRPPDIRGVNSEFTDEILGGAVT